MATIRILSRSSWFKVLRCPLLCRHASTSGQTFKTDLHTDNLYPGSNWKDRFAVKKTSIPSDHPSGFNGVINISELQVKVNAEKIHHIIIGPIMRLKRITGKSKC